MYINITTLFSISLLLTTLNACTSVNASKENAESKLTTNRKSTEQSREYWYDGNAEISSYKISQARYGEIHVGTEIFVYVTEPFSKKYNTKSDQNNADNIPVLKLNRTKKFTTGIYPYSIMTSTFFPFENNIHSTKITSSMQEWCGMTFMEMINNGDFTFNLDSYFEGQSYKNKTLDKTVLEDDIWSLIRLNPDQLPVGNIKMIPSFAYQRLTHKETKAYEVTLSKVSDKETIEYSILYPELEKSLYITFEKEFPYKVLYWEETYASGYGSNRKMLTTKAELLETIKVDYWNKNSNKDKGWRTKLKLD